MVTDLNATDKMPMYEMPLIYVFGVWGLGRAFFCVGVLGNGILSSAFCPEIWIDSQSTHWNTFVYWWLGVFLFWVIINYDDDYYQRGKLKNYLVARAYLSYYTMYWIIACLTITSFRLDLSHLSPASIWLEWVMRQAWLPIRITPVRPIYKGWKVRKKMRQLLLHIQKRDRSDCLT